MALRDGIGLGALLAALALHAGGAEAQPAARNAGRPEQRLEVELGLAERRIVLQPGISDILALPRPAKTLIIGDPRVADATLNGDRAIVLTGQRVGETNLIILGQDGSELLRAAIRVGPRGHKIEVRNGVAAQSYSCTPTCRPDATTATTQYSGPWGTTTAVTTTGDVPSDLITQPGAAPAPAAGAPPAAAGSAPAAAPSR